MEGVLKRNFPDKLDNENYFYDFSSDCNFQMNHFSSIENPYNSNTNSGPTKYSLDNIQQVLNGEKFHRTNNSLSTNSLPISSKKTELEKLFSHATEVKGDLESVIHALVGIIGTGPKDESQSIDPVALETTIESHNLCREENETEKFPAKYYNHKWTNENAPSVNVANVLKTVRENKIKNEKFQITDCGLSSGSSKERFVEKIDLTMNLRRGNNFKESFRSMLSDPGHIDQCNSLINKLENPRKHKSQYSTIFKDEENWNSTDTLVKKIKSVKTSNDMVDGIALVQMENNHNPNDNLVEENNDVWTSYNPISSFNQYPDKVKCDWSKHEVSNNALYRNLSNCNWNTNNELINECPGNLFVDESSCSSWSKLSSNNSQIQGSKLKSGITNDIKYEKQTPSVSVSDSEGSIEPIRNPPVKKIPRLPSLCTQLRSKQGMYEILLINQPEQQHRARYMTEGSRGAVKDRGGNGYPAIQLIGWKKTATLQIFVGSEEGRIKPHSFYQACKVSGKQILSCKERVFDNAGLIEVQLEAKDNQTVILDCIGILKLRNVDVERRAGIQRIKQKSTMARLVFRVNLPHGDGYFTCLQVTSDQILCTQPVGTPEISKISLCEGSCKGNVELFIIGKNIVKSTRVLFQDYSETRGIVWKAEAKVDTEYLQQTHLICIVPPYCDENLKSPLTVQVVLNCNGRLSEPRLFTYLPDPNNIQININKSFKYPNWKIEKSDFSLVSPFPMENRSVNLEATNRNADSNSIKLANDILYGLEYLKPNEDPLNTSNLFDTIPNETDYSHIYTVNKDENGILLNSEMNWIPSSSSKDIPMSVIQSPFERLPNSLDSNIENECILHENHSMQIQQSETVTNFTESNEILTNL